MEKSSKRGKIPQSDWPLIMARYEAGETLSSIARTYDCSPPAISYVVSRSRARQPGGETSRPIPTGETQLIKAGPGNGVDHAVNRDVAATPPAHLNPAAPQAAPAGDRRFEVRPGNGNGLGRPMTGEREAHASDPFAPNAPSPAPRPAEPPPSQGSAAHGPAPQGPALQGPANADQR